MLNTLLATRLLSQYKVDLLGNILSGNQTSM
ncbi:DEHA2F17578p [Debaryomyces hansenii CBS767]|uniref:DEHA2F17578p n=1 Tax=Debaryomyces hansenii (strain ATCC 36239 / CBS 767 / BCRC 21394 / JCM 1990 / NBRC 0083 / IGC 2968) TaxID=284592 RepID=B5RUI7_DEBHA|nr:DEHA2F17578p [Debaryomyces hansenii CBS767]CAR66365.1 DEHA2F17578p [Debaryomyces hansenii CBS767]|eukprot:XP_002770844.1 DEHA2F17578p [Debaryomyces hansenii CBS767]